MFKKLIILVVAAVVVYACTKNEAALNQNGVALTTTKAYAQQITKAFETSGVSTTYGHYYGKIIMNELTNLDGVKNILAFNALDGDGHIIFKATDSKGQIINEAYAVEVGSGYPPTLSASHSDPVISGRIAYIGGKLEDGAAQQWQRVSKQFQ